MSLRLKKLVFGLLVVTLLAPGAYVVFQGTGVQKAEAGWPTLELGSISNAGKWLWDAGVAVVENTGYRMLKLYLNRLGRSLAIKTFSDFAGGAQGQDKMFEERPLGFVVLEAFENAGGFFIESLAIGVDMANEQGGVDKKTTKIESLTKEQDNFRKQRDSIIDSYPDEEKIQKECAATSDQEDWAKCIEDKKKGATFQTNRQKIESECIAQSYDQTEAARCIDKKTDALTAGYDKILAENSETLDALNKLRRSSEVYEKRTEELRKRGNQGGYSSTAADTINALCNPKLSVKLELMLGISPSYQPPEEVPICTIKQALDNWGDVLKETGIDDLLEGRTNGWKALRAMIDPKGSELQVAFDLYANLWSEQVEQVQHAAQQNVIDQIIGAQPVKTVAGLIKTPGAVVKSGVDAMIGESYKQSTSPVLTGKLKADALDLVSTFVDSFAGKSWEYILKGISDRASSRNIAGSYGGSSGGYGGGFYDEESSPVYSGQQAARVRTASLAKLEYNSNPEEETYLLAQLQESGDCYSNPNYCVISSGFAEAIQNKMTVREAIKEGKISGNGIFGFRQHETRSVIEVDPKEAANGNFPYSAMVILRKYRVIPVGWEIAALYIAAQKENPACDPGGTKSCTLGYVISQFDVPTSPFYRLVDPDWILKLPAVQCNLKGYGPSARHYAKDQRSASDTLCKSDTNGDGEVACTLAELSDERKEFFKTLNGCVDGEKLTTASLFSTGCQAMLNDKKIGDPLDALDVVPLRAEVCVDERSCLSENPDGSCKQGAYGYCLEERKKVVIGGRECKQEFASCQKFIDESAKKASYFLKDTISGFSANACKAESAGCKWLSAKKNYGSLAQTKAWSSSSSDKVYLAASAVACLPQYEGCRQLAGGAQTAYRLAPKDMKCDKTINGVPGYKRNECRDYVLHCKPEYAECQSYAPINGDPNIAGTSPVSCASACAGVASFTESRTPTEERFSYAVPPLQMFVQSTADVCSVDDVGCEEFTDLDARADASGERLSYFSRLRACAVRPAEKTPENTFYTWYGSDQEGSRLASFEFEQKSTNKGPEPICASGLSDCSCNRQSDVPEAKLGKVDPIKGTCREYININGNPTYRWSNLLVALTSQEDCHLYRRSVSGEQYRISKSLSKSCPQSASQCHEYKAPQAGNIQIVFKDSFEDKKNTKWLYLESGKTTAEYVPVSSETETLLQTSIKAPNAVTIQRPLEASLVKGSSYLLDLAIRPEGAVGTTSAVQAALSGLVGKTALGADKVTLKNEEWNHVRFFFQELPAASDVAGSLLTLSLSRSGGTGVTVSIDQAIFKKIDGVTYRRKGSWDNASQCANQYSCQEYRNQYGQTEYIQSFERVCPLEMVGCKQMSDPNKELIVATANFNDGSNGEWSASQGNASQTSSYPGMLTVTPSGELALKTDYSSLSQTAAFLNLPVTIKKNTPYTIRFATKDAFESVAVTVKSTGAKGGIVSTQVNSAFSLAGVPTSPSGSGLYDYSIANAKWEQLVFKTPGIPLVGPEETVTLVISFSSAFQPNKTILLDNFTMTQDGVNNALYLVQDDKKSCPIEQNGCTAYGVPDLDSGGNIKRKKNAKTEKVEEQWGTQTYLITPEEIEKGPIGKRGICSESELSCKQYTLEGVSDSGDLQKTTVSFRDPGKNLCHLDADGSWKRKICKGTYGPSISCTENSDCFTSDGKDGECITVNCQNNSCYQTPSGSKRKVCLGLGSLVSCVDDADCRAFDPQKAKGCAEVSCALQVKDQSDWVKTCPAEQNTCTRLADPECGANRLSNKPCASDTECGGPAYSGECVKTAEKGFTAKFYTIPDSAWGSTAPKNHDVSDKVLVAQKTHKAIDFIWERRAPIANVPENRFLVVWEGKIDAPHADTYTFKTYADDGLRLWIDSNTTPVINDWSSHPPEERSGNIFLTKGEHALKLVYFENTDLAQISLSWQSPRVPPALVPAGDKVGGSLGLCAYRDSALRNDYGRKTEGVSCKPEYYMLANSLNSKGCESGVDVEKGCLLFRDDSRGQNTYLSGQYYMKYWENSTPVALNMSADSALNKVSDEYNKTYHNRYPNLDANRVLKVRYDRECKTALSCTDYIQEKSGKLVCLHRAPCILDGDGQCAGETFRSATKSGPVPQLKGRFAAPYAQNTQMPDTTFAFLTGMSRPDFTFGATEILGGHDGFFNWNQILSDNAGDDPTVGELAMGGAKRNSIVNSCRLYPRQDSPEERKTYTQKIVPVDACNYSENGRSSEGVDREEYRGIYGYCLEPNPKYHAAGLAVYRDEISSRTANVAKYKYGYPNFCLNWLPVDAIAAQPSFGGDGLPNAIMSPKQALYYCIEPKDLGSQDLPNSVCKNRDKNQTELSTPDGLVRCTETDELALDTRKGDVEELSTIPKAALTLLIAGGAGATLITFPLGLAVSAGIFSAFIGDLGQGGTGLFYAINFKEIGGADSVGWAGIRNLQDRFTDKLFVYSAFDEFVEERRDVPANPQEIAIQYRHIKSITYTITDETGSRRNTPADFGREPLPQSPTKDTLFTFLLRDKESYRSNINGKTMPAVEWNTVFNLNTTTKEGPVVRQCNGQVGKDRSYIGIRPIFNKYDPLGITPLDDAVITKWHWIYCDKDWSGALEAMSVSITINLEYPKTYEIRNRIASHKICTAFVKTTQNGHAVPVQSAQLSSSKPIGAVSGTNSTQSSGVYNPDDVAASQTKIILGGKQEQSNYWEDRYGPYKSPPKPSEYNEIKTPIDFERSEIDILPLTGDNSITTKYFARAYEFWRWKDGKYVKTAWLDDKGDYQGTDAQDKQALVTAWNKSKAKAEADRPRITRADSGAIDSKGFDVIKFERKDEKTGRSYLTPSRSRVEIQFHAYVNENQLPIRYLAVNWGDSDWGDGDQPIIYMQSEGSGRSNKDPENPSKLYRFSMMHEYDDDPDGQTVCVRVMDNWEARTQECATISYPEGASVIRLTNPQTSNSFSVPTRSIQSVGSSAPAPAPAPTPPKQAPIATPTPTPPKVSPAPTSAPTQKRSPRPATTKKPRPGSLDTKAPRG